MSKEYVDKLSYLSYSTIYSARGTLNNELRSRACFADILNRGEISEEHYEIYMIRDKNYALLHNACNLCMLTESELKKHIILARRLFPFSYSVEESKYDGYSAFKVNIDITAKHFYHRYLLTWIRYAYEFPYNLILSDALRMKHYYLRRESVTNLFVLCANSFTGEPVGYGSGHSISCQQSSFLKEYELKDKIKQLAANQGRYTAVNSIYPYKWDAKYPKIDSKNGRYLSYWTNNEDFEERAKVYLKGYKQLKK